MRRRSLATDYPLGIDPRKLPNYCYWDAKNQHWYGQFFVGDKWTRRKIAGAKATMAELHAAMERKPGQDLDNLIWLGGKFKESVQYKQVSDKSRKDWDYCFKTVTNHPSKRAGVTMGKGQLVDWNEEVVQKLIDQIAGANGPSAAKHCAAYLKRVFTWGKARGHVKRNPVGKIELPKQRNLRRLPTPEVIGKLAALAQERGALPPHTKGSSPSYIWKALVIAYRCRFRGVEVFSLTDDQVLKEGLQSARRKGSNDNITRWNPDLRAAVDAAQAHRDALWKAKRMPVPMRAEDRPLIVGEQGKRVTSDAWQGAWRDFLTMAIKAEVIKEEDRFGLHDLKRRGVTDTKGTKAEKMLASGHKSASMLDVYDFSIPTVDAAGE